MSEITLEELVTAGIKKLKMAGVGHVTQAHEKVAVPSDPEHAGEELSPVPQSPTEPPRS